MVKSGGVVEKRETQISVLKRTQVPRFSKEKEKRWRKGKEKIMEGESRRKRKKKEPEGPEKKQGKFLLYYWDIIDVVIKIFFKWLMKF